MVNALPPQNRAILDHLQKKGSITNIEAQATLRIRALPKRISELKEAGYSIEREFKTDPTGQRYVRYYLTDDAG